jgi:hypothetical protein
MKLSFDRFWLWKEDKRKWMRKLGATGSYSRLGQHFVGRRNDVRLTHFLFATVDAWSK